MRIVLTLFLFCVCMSIKAQQQDMTEMKKAIDLMQGMYDITFVYDSSLVTAKPQAFPSAGNSLKENLERIFGGTGIKWEIRDEYVLLFHPNNYTFSGYVCEDSGETLINVTVLDLNTLKGTLSNEHGFFSITLPEGKHKFRFSYIGYQDVVKEVDLSSNYNGVIYLKESSTALKEVVVVADMNAPLRTTQTGKVSLTSEQLNTEFSLLSSPDLVKTLQNLPGVASGTELLSGMYVHGGKNDENLFLLDGTPLYQINHLGGLFSAFNTDIIKNVDLYKSGFPARYGGRLSSVVDVRTKEGNMKEFHGTFSLGLLDGRVQFEGKYSINSLVYWVTYVHNVVYSFYRSMIYCYINSTQRCAGSIVIDIIPTNGADKRKFFPFAPYFPVTNVIKRYFYPYFPAIIGIKGYSFPYFPYLSGIMKIKTALYSLFSRLDWHKTVVFPCLGEIYEGIRSLSWEIPVT